MALDDIGQTLPTDAPATAPAPFSAPAVTPAAAPSMPDVRGLIDQSRKIGATDAQIRDLMVKAPFLQDTWQASEKAGIAPDAVFQHFGLAAPKPADAPTDQSMPSLDDFGRPIDTSSMPKQGGPQSQIAADINAVGQGVVGGTGSLIAGAGREITAGAARNTTAQLAAMDAIDQQKDVPDDQDVMGYQYMTPEQKASARAGLTAANVGLANRDPNAITRAGAAISGAASTMFPVAPENEGIQTGAGRLIGNLGPALVATAAGTLVGGPVGGVLATAAVIGSQSYDSTYQEAIAKGATPDQADDAAGKAALSQIVATSLPVSRVLQVIPVPLREGFVKTLVNIGQHGVEMGSGNALGALAQNYVAQQSYDPNRSLTQGVAVVGLEGAIAGLVIRGGGAAVQAARATAAAHEAVASIGAATDVDGAIAAASKATAAPSAAAEPTPGWGDLFGRPDAAPPETAPAAQGVAAGDVTKQNDVWQVLANRLSASMDQDRSSGLSEPSAKTQAYQDALQLHFDRMRETAPAAGVPGGSAPPEQGSAPAPTAAPGPQSVSAAASGDSAGALSISDMKANRRVVEMDQLLSAPQTGDAMIYVPGSFPTLAERSGDPLVSQYENLLRQRNSGEFVGDGKILTENNKARVNLYDEHTVPDTTLNSMRADRAARWSAASDQILPTAKPADLTPVLDWVQQQLGNPRIQENDAVRSVLENFRDRIVDSNGNLKSDPAAVWGIHDNLQNQLAKAKDPLNMTGAEKFAEGQILAAKGLIDQAMNVATDNRFQGALDGYARDSKAINSGVLLNNFRPKLTNMAGDLQAAGFHRFVVGLAKERGDPGIDPSMDISDQTMRSLMNIDADLKRAGLIKLGAAAGSPTNLLGALAEKAGLDAAHSVLGAVPGVGKILATGQQYLAQRKLASDTAKHLAPPEGGYRYPEAPDAETPTQPIPVRPPAADLFNRQPDRASVPAPPDEPRTPGQEIATDTRTGREYVKDASGGEAAPAQSQVEREQSAAAAIQERSDRDGTNTAPAQSGNLYGSTTALTPAGKPVAIRYVVREASDLKTSQLPDGRPNPSFPPDLQPRDRTRAASMAQVNDIANNLAPERLGYASDTATGAPVVGPDGFVESGNGRTMAIQRAYAEGSTAAESYRTWLGGQGFNVAGMREPVLVRERTAPLDMTARAQLADEMGASPTMAMAAPEKAAADAKRIPTDVLSMIQRGDVTSQSNAPFVRAFATHAVPASEHANFMTADGELSLEGATRVRNALTQRAYGDNALVSALTEHADPDLKAFGGALVDAAGPMAKLRGAIESKAVGPGNDITGALVEAAKVIRTARRSRISIADAVAQTDAFAPPRDPRTESILRATFGDDFAGRMSRPKLAGLLSNFAAEIQNQSGLFGEGKTADQVFDDLSRK